MTDRVTLEKTARFFIDALEQEFGPNKIGFAVLVFDFGSGGNLGWASNAERGTMIKALQEFIEKNGGVSVFTH